MFNRRHGRHRYFCGPWSAFQKNHQTTGKVLHSVLLFRTSIIYLHSSCYLLFYFFRGFFFFDILFLQGGYFGMVGMFSVNLGSLSKKNHQTIVMDLHSVPSNSLFCFGDLFIYSGGPHAMVRFYLDLNASFCSLIDFRCDALPAVISWNGSSLICLSASLSQ